MYRPKPLRGSIYGALFVGAALFLGTIPGATGDADQTLGHLDLGTAKAGGSGLEVSEIESVELAGTNPTHLQVWVNVTNPGSEPAVNLTGEMRGAETAIVGGRWITYESRDSVNRGASKTETFEVVPRTILTVSASISSNSPLGSLGLLVTDPNGNEYPATVMGQTSVQIPQKDVDAGVFGEWTATITHSGGLRPISYYFSAACEFTDVYDNVSLPELPAGETYQFYYNIWAEEPDTTIPPGMTITVNGTVLEGGVESRVSYVASVGKPVEQLPVGPTSTSGGGDIGAPAVAVVVVISVGAIGAYAWMRRGWRPAQLLRMLKRQPPEPPAAPPPQSPG